MGEHGHVGVEKFGLPILHVLMPVTLIRFPLVPRTCSRLWPRSFSNDQIPGRRPRGSFIRHDPPLLVPCDCQPNPQAFHTVRVVVLGAFCSPLCPAPDLFRLFYPAYQSPTAIRHRLPLILYHNRVRVLFLPHQRHRRRWIRILLGKGWLLSSER